MVVSDDVIVTAVMGIVLEPLVSTPVVCPARVICPPLPRTSTPMLVPDELNDGIPPFHGTLRLLAVAAGVVGVPGMEGVALSAKVSTVELAAGPLPDVPPEKLPPVPTRKKSIRPMVMLKSSRAVVEML